MRSSSAGSRHGPEDFAPENLAVRTTSMRFCCTVTNNATAELEAALSRVTRLAGEHATQLDSAVRHMAAHAWVGGGAPQFAQQLANQRKTLQEAFNSAAESIVQRIRQLGGRAQAPSFSTSVGSPSTAPGRFAGMDVEATKRLVDDLYRAGGELPGAGLRLSNELSALCLSPVPGRQITEVGVWADQQVQDLRRRLARIQQNHDSGLISKATAGFGVFGGYAADPDGVGKLTTAAANGDVNALKALLERQQTGKDATLAARLHAWWQQLDTATQNRLIAIAPNLIGGLNGLPSAIRDQANRKYLAAQKTAIAAELQRLRASSSPEADEAIKRLELKMKQIEQVERSLALGGQNGRSPAFLLQLELGEWGKTAISYGNPDEADNIAVYVPGTGTKLESFAGDAERAVLTWDQASVSASGKKIASIAWLGYEAPQWSMTLELPPENNHTVINMKAAEAGASKLSSFTDGLHAAHRPGIDIRLTVLGHSYGSTVTGLAAMSRPKTFADQVILVGSPGVGAKKAKELGVDSVWVGEAPNDPVGDIGLLPKKKDFLSLLPGIPFGPAIFSLISTVRTITNTTGPLGPDPSIKQFGANQFYVRDSGHPAYTFKGHSSYWDRRSESLYNIGLLINGKYDMLISLPDQSPHPQTSQDLKNFTPTPKPAESKNS